MTLLSLNLLPQKRLQRLPPHLQLIGSGVQKHQQLRRWLSGSDLDGWKSVLPFIQSVLLHRPSGWLCVMFDSHVLIWPMSKRDPAVYIVSVSYFRQRLQSKLRQPIPVALRHSVIVHSLIKDSTWSTKYLRWLDGFKMKSQKHRDNLEQK